MLPDLWSAVKQILPHSEAFNAMGVKVGLAVNAIAATTTTALVIEPVIYGATLDEWKVIGIISSICFSILGIAIQITFKWLDRRDKKNKRY